MLRAWGIRGIGLTAGAVAAMALMLLASQGAQEPSELLKWGPPTLRPSAQQLSSSTETNPPSSFKWGAPSLRPKGQATKAEAQVHEAKQRVQIRGPEGTKGLSINVDVKQDHNSEVEMAPVKLEIVMPGGHASKEPRAQKEYEGQRAKQLRAQGETEGRRAEHMPTEELRVPVLAVADPQAPQSFVMQRRAAEAAEERRLRAERLQRLEAREFRAARTISLAQAPTPTTDMVKHMYSAQELMSLEDALQAQARDARDNAFTENGVERAHQLQAQAKEVKQRLLQLPDILAHKLRKASRQGAKAEGEVAKDSRRLAKAEAELKHEQKVEGPRKVREESRVFQAKVELQRAAADALADVMGKPAPSFHHLTAPEPAVPKGPSVSSLKLKVKQIKKKLQAAQQNLKTSVAEHSYLAQNIAKAQHHNSEAELNKVYGASMRGLGARETMLSMPSKGGLKTLDPEWGAHEIETPKKVKKMANVTLEGHGPPIEGPKVQWCKWGTEMVPCSPGYGGAWLEHHITDRGIWPLEEPPKAPPHLRAHVKAGERSKSYIDDMFGYGQAGIFGARSKGPKVFKGRMLSGGHTNDKPKVIEQKQKELAKMPVHDILQSAMMADARKHNVNAPEWTDRLLNDVKHKYHYMSTHLKMKDGSELPKDNWGSSVHGIIDPNLQDQIKEEGEKKYHEAHKDMDHSEDNWSSSVHGIIDPNLQDQIKEEGEKKYHEAHKDVDHSKDNWGSSVHGIINPNLQDQIKEEGSQKYHEAHKDVDHSKDNWGSSVHGIINPNLQDKIIEEGKSKYSGQEPQEPAAKGRWGSTVHGIVDPNVIDNIMDPESAQGRVQGAKGLDSQALHTASGSRDANPFMQRTKGLQRALEADKQAQLRSLERLADVSR